MNGERREFKEPTVEGWLRVVSIVVMNSAAVKIPNPMLRYVACLDGESEDARARATRALRPALEQMVERRENAKTTRVRTMMRARKTTKTRRTGTR